MAVIGATFGGCGTKRVRAAINIKLNNTLFLRVKNFISNLFLLKLNTFFKTTYQITK